MEHGNQSGDNFASRIAVMTAVLSTVGALFSHSGGATQNDAMLMKMPQPSKKPKQPTSGITIRPRATSKIWPNCRYHSARTPIKPSTSRMVERYRAEKAEIKAAAEKLEAESKAFEQKSDDATGNWSLA